MKVAECKLESIGPYSQGKYHQAERKAQELDDDYERRTWRERCHVNADGYIFITPMTFANNLKIAAQYLALPIPGKGGRALFTKHFEAGVMVYDGVVLPERPETVAGEWQMVPPNGQKGGRTRVPRCFPLIPKWSGTVTYYISDDIITEEVFREVLDYAGSLIGVSRFRPARGGYYGRFKVVDVVWVEV